MGIRRPQRRRRELEETSHENNPIQKDIAARYGRDFAARTALEKRENIMTQNKEMASCWRGIVSALAVLLLAGSLPAQASHTCRGRLHLSSDEYQCAFRSDTSAAFVDGTIVFSDPGGDAFTATLVIGEGASSTAYCTCKTRFGKDRDKFNKDKSFECVTGFAPDVAETLEGRVNGEGSKIDHGQIWSADPFDTGFVRWAFDCELGDEDDDSDDSDGPLR